MEKVWFTTQDLCERWGVSDTWIWKQVERGALFVKDEPTSGAVRRFLFHLEWVEDFIERTTYDGSIHWDWSLPEEKGRA